MYTVIDLEHPLQSVNYFLETGPADICSKHQIPDPDLESLIKAVKYEVKDRIWWNNKPGGGGE